MKLMNGGVSRGGCACKACSICGLLKIVWITRRVRIVVALIDPIHLAA